MSARRSPDVRKYVGLCMACEHWQVDVRPGAVSDLGGAQSATWALAQAHSEHIADCPGAGGRVKYQGQWVEAPRMSDGQSATGALMFQPFPRWWVAR